MLVDVPIVKPGKFRVPVDEICERISLAGVECHRPSRCSEQEHLASGVAAARQGNRRGIKPSMHDEFVVGAVHEAADRRMHPVRADDEIEPACARTLERHVHTVVVPVIEFLGAQSPEVEYKLATGGRIGPTLPPANVLGL